MPGSSGGGRVDVVDERARPGPPKNDQLFLTVPAFEHAFVRTDWFGDEVLWLASDADAMFRSLTNVIAEAFPEYPPYEGQFDEVVPHLTIADHGPPEAMWVADQAVQPHLPIRTVTRAVTLMVEQPSGKWETAESFALGG